MKKTMEKVAKLADELGKQPPPSDPRAKKEYEALLKKFCQKAAQVDKDSTLFKKKEEAARKGMPKDQQKVVAGKLGKYVGDIDKLGTGLKKSALKVQANAKKGGQDKGKGKDKEALQKMKAAHQAMSELGTQIAPSQTKVILGG
jgi:hypothetical protein